jgi:hypothetical protein
MEFLNNWRKLIMHMGCLDHRLIADFMDFNLKLFEKLLEGERVGRLEGNWDLIESSWVGSLRKYSE